jgi:hypothetical protein
LIFFLALFSRLGKGGYFITLPHGVVDRLTALRGPGESYS